MNSSRLRSLTNTNLPHKTGVTDRAPSELEPLQGIALERRLPG